MSFTVTSVMQKKVIFSVLFLLLSFNPILESECAKILFYFGSSPYSHKVAVWPLIWKLAENDHKVVFLTPPFPKESPHASPHPNIHIFHPRALTVYWKEKEDNVQARDMISSRIKGFNEGRGYWDGQMQTGLEICRVIFRSLEVQKWTETAEFDLLIIDTPYNECALGLAHKLNSPHILFGTSSLYMWHYEMFGLPDEILPNYYYNNFPPEMTFFQRLRNALTPLQWFYSTNRVSYIIPQMEKLMRKSLNISDMPGFDDLEKSTSLFFLNTHFIQEYPRSLPPFMVSIGGMHLIDRKNSEIDEMIPSNIANFLELHASEGFIYVSFGTQVDVSRAPPLVIDKLMKTFAILDIAVLCIWSDVDKVPKAMSEKVLLVKWAPQIAILGHPKLKVFITRGGSLSYQEGLYFGVPMIAFPLTPEEDYNSILIEKEILGCRMDIAYFTQYELATNIRKLISDETYKSNVMRLSELFKERPQSPVDTAMWWTFYVLRHKNLTFTKPLAIRQTWWQRRLLDVWLFLIIMIFGVLTILVMSVNYMFCKKVTVPSRIVKQKYKVS